MQSVTPSARAITSVELTLSVADGNEDVVGLVAEYAVGDDEPPQWRPVNLISAGDLTRIQTTAQGSQVVVAWPLLDQATLDGEPVSLADTVGDEVLDTLAVSYGETGPQNWRLRLSVVDEGGLSNSPQVIGPILVGNTAPTVELNQNSLAGSIRGDVVLEFTLEDDNADFADVDVEFRPEGDFEWRSAALEFGETNQLVPRTGASYAVAWDSRAQTNVDPSVPQGIGNTTTRVDVRIRASDEAVSGTRFFGAWARPDFSLEVVNQSPPEVLGVDVPRSALVGGFAPVPVFYSVADDDSDPVDVRVEFSLDGGANYIPCAEAPDGLSEGQTGLSTQPLVSGGVRHQFTWLPGLEIPIQPDGVVVRVTASDGLSGQLASEQVFLRRAPGPSADPYL
ncbi:MAG: hypothetical protein AAFY60_17945, partial [Myxococcota bacterium]